MCKGLTRDKWGGAEVGIDGSPDGPKGSCCNAGGTCSPAAANTDRWVLPKFSAAKNGMTFSMKYFLPAGVTCERCVLQMIYMTGNSNDQYPEAFWNCADIKIVSCGTVAECKAIDDAKTKNDAAAPTTPTIPVATTVEAGAQCGGMGWTGKTKCVDGYECSFGCSGCSSTNHKCVKKTTTGGVTTGGGGAGAGGATSGACKSKPSCTACLWEAHGACYKDWKKDLCDGYASQGYVWCGAGGSTTTGTSTGGTGGTGGGAGTWVEGGWSNGGTGCPTKCGEKASTATRTVTCVDKTPAGGTTGSTSTSGSTTGSTTATTTGSTTGATTATTTGSTTGSTTGGGGGGSTTDTGSCPAKMSLSQCNDFKVQPYGGSGVELTLLSILEYIYICVSLTSTAMPACLD